MMNEKSIGERSVILCFCLPSHHVLSREILDRELLSRRSLEHEEKATVAKRKLECAFVDYGIRLSGSPDCVFGLIFGNLHCRCRIESCPFRSPEMGIEGNRGRHGGESCIRFTQSFKSNIETLFSVEVRFSRK